MTADAIRPEGDEIEALRTDRYLEALLAQRDRAPGDGRRPNLGMGAGAGSEHRVPAERLDPALVTTIASLDRALVRVHPSFRFEERLARRLAEVADSMRVSEAAGAEGVNVPVALPFDASIDPAGVELPATGPALPAVPRPLLIGALSLAGAAIVAWRFGRPVDPMTRAVRAAHQLRLGGGHSLPAMPGLPRPPLPRPGVPRPGVPRPSVPRPGVPRPSVPRPSVPRPRFPGAQ